MKHLNRRGFTIIELLSALVLIGILASIAIPRLRGPVAKADAAKVYGDFVAVRQAAYDYMEENGRFPRSAGWGSIPRELRGEVPAFEYKNVEYRWVGRDFRRRRRSVQGARHLGYFYVRYRNYRELGEELRDRQPGFAAGRIRDFYWNRNRAIYVIAE